MNSRMKKHTIFSRFSHTLKYIFLTGMMCACMTSCGNTDGYSTAEKYETEILQEPLEETPASLPEPTMESASESEPIPVPEPMPATEPALEVEQEEVIDYTQANTEKFYQIAEEDCGLSHEETQRWFDIIMEDDILDGGIRAIRDLIFDDIDGNGMTDMVIMVQKTENFYGEGALYFYMNEEEPYCFADEMVPYFDWNICYADLNRDGNVEIAVALRGTGNGGSGDWHKVLFGYTGSAMERLEFPSDYDDEDDEYEVGLYVDVIMEPEPDTYTAYCSYLDESITFKARNIYEGDKQLAYLEKAPKDVGGNLRGYYDLQVVAWGGRNALQVREYLYGEGGNVHCVGEACFILIWDERGNGSVADWWVEGNLGDSGLIFYSAEDLTL